MKIHEKVIHLPHINYRVRITVYRDCDKPDDCQAWTQRNSRWCSTIFVPKDCEPPLLGHEIVHVLRFIVLDRHMTFEHEYEHMAYIMQYVMGQAFGYVWGRR